MTKNAIMRVVLVEYWTDWSLIFAPYNANWEGSKQFRLGSFTDSLRGRGLHCICFLKWPDSEKLKGSGYLREARRGQLTRKGPEKRRHLRQPKAEPALSPTTPAPPGRSRPRSPHRPTAPASAGSRYQSGRSSSPRSRRRRAAGPSVSAAVGSGPHQAGTVRALGPAVQSSWCRRFHLRPGLRPSTTKKTTRTTCRGPG